MFLTWINIINLDSIKFKETARPLIHTEKTFRVVRLLCLSHYTTRLVLRGFELLSGSHTPRLLAKMPRDFLSWWNAATHQNHLCLQVRTVYSVQVQERQCSARSGGSSLNIRTLSVTRRWASPAPTFECWATAWWSGDLGLLFGFGIRAQVVFCERGITENLWIPFYQIKLQFTGNHLDGDHEHLCGLLWKTVDLCMYSICIKTSEVEPSKKTAEHFSLYVRNPVRLFYNCG